MTASVAITTRAREAYDEGQLALIRDTVAKDCNPAELALFLETCARHDLDPIIKQIWVIKIKGVLQPVVARDGLLAIANRHTGAGWTMHPGEFMGCQSNFVRKFDLFDFDQVERDDGTVRFAVTHKPRNSEGQPVFGGEDGSERGPIVGSWAVVRRRGHNDTFYQAFWKTYNKAENTWRTHPDAMIVKCAESMALRKAFSVSGVIGEGEVERSTLTEVNGGVQGEIRWPQDEAQAESLKQRFEVLGYRRAKVRTLVNACEDEDGFRDLLARLDTAVDEMVARAEGQPEVVDGEVA